MRWKLALLIPLMAVSQLWGQAWTGVLDPARAADWSSVGATIINRGTICATPSLTAGNANASANATAITNAITSCGTSGTPAAPTDNVILLPAGTYYFTTLSFTRNNFTLRGAGADQTTLIATSIGGGTNTGIITPHGSASLWKGATFTTANWTAGYTQGATTLTFDGHAGLLVGSQVILDQINDNILGGDTGDIYACGGSAGSSTIAPTCGDSGNTVDNGRTDRAQTQTVTVVACGTSTPGAACSSNTITISPGLYSPNWNRHPGQSLPQAWWGSGLPITGVGLENFTLDASGITGTHSSGAITWNSATNCWARGVKIVNSTSNSLEKHFLTYVTDHITVTDSYMYGSVPSSGGYGVDFGFMSSANLSQNNVCNHIASCMMTEGSQGSVFAYNFAADNYYCGSGCTVPTWQQQDEAHHSIGDNYNLYEGNIGSGFANDKIHGGSWMQTIFRSRASGRDPALTSGQAKAQSTIAFNDYMLNRYTNAVGNVLGTVGYHTVYEWFPASSSDSGSTSSGDHSVFALGWSGNEGTKGSNINDLLVRSTLVRWGNWDNVNNAVQWNASEKGDAAPVYPGLANPSQSLPPSFYLGSKPSWWGATLPWPGIGPDIDTTAIGSTLKLANTANHVALNPAANCYLNIMGGLTDGSSGALTFNADTCYGASGPTSSVSIAPSSLAFGSIAVNVTSPYQTVTLSNVGAGQLTNISIALVSGAQFAISSNTCGATLAAGANCTLHVTFTPTTTGAKNDTLVFTNDAIDSPQTVPLSGTGTSPSTCFVQSSSGITASGTLTATCQ